MTLITSPHNPRISQIHALHTTKGRKKSGLFFMEGPHLLVALLDAGIVPREIYYQPAMLQRTSEGDQLLARLMRVSSLSPDQLVEVSEQAMDALSDVQTSQGVISVLPLKQFTLATVRARRLPATRSVVLVLDDLADPGNMGTILRTALAADVDAVLLTPHCVDCYSPKVVRAAAGAHVGLPIEDNLSWTDIASKVAAHCAQGLRVLLAEAGNHSLYDEIDLTIPFALIIGNEAQGPSREARRLATHTISIPLANGVESLNAAIATGVILYEAVRQKRHAAHP